MSFHKNLRNGYLVSVQSVNQLPLICSIFKYVPLLEWHQERTEDRFHFETFLKRLSYYAVGSGVDHDLTGFQLRKVLEKKIIEKFIAFERR